MTWARKDTEVLFKRSGQAVDVSFPLNARGVNSIRVTCQSVPIAKLLEDGLRRIVPLNGERGEAFVHYVDRLVTAAHAQAERRMRGRRTR